MHATAKIATSTLRHPCQRQYVMLLGNFADQEISTAGSASTRCREFD